MNNKQNTTYVEIFSQILKTGKRSYFFDVRETKAGDFYLTITESKKLINQDGSFKFEKNKIYLYKEDFKEFREQLDTAFDFIIKNKGQVVISEKHNDNYLNIQRDKMLKKDDNETDSFTEVNFDDI